VDEKFPIRWNWGLPGVGPKDNVAVAGNLSFVLDNSEKNSGELVGYYSPGHPNCRAGWGIGATVRVVLHFRSRYFVKWRGTVSSIKPMPGSHGAKRVSVACVDWMSEAERTTVPGLVLMTNTRSDQVFSAVVAAIPRQPHALEVGRGMDTYAYALDNSGTDVRALSEFQRIANSELGFIYIRHTEELRSDFVVPDQLDGGEILIFADHREQQQLVLLGGVCARLGDVAIDGSSYFTPGSIPAGRSWRVPLRLDGHELDGAPAAENLTPVDPANLKPPIAEVNVSLSEDGRHVLYAGNVPEAVARQVFDSGLAHVSLEVRVESGGANRDFGITEIRRATPVGVAIVRKPLMPHTDLRLNNYILQPADPAVTPAAC
jgi:hypothetical protein